MEPQQPPTQPFLPPADLVHLESARQRFGAPKVDLLIELMHTGDPFYPLEIPGFCSRWVQARLPMPIARLRLLESSCKAGI
ncbi:hypothetical protein KSC_014250 [Ktedonobacter sp. SOSP1-52]|uniref:hypothetical protein n=1 Tax=Ktedonobacter sp. SOSP1-52 TaxID=2778366 RepID=UPI001914E846|nr:hypothetical protein [Ktedonobacter sp. SOSP1-52]GHO62533.1 hypothetical protein KSC_014250 [Ktedonobacter sp. SOSP1-52]